MHGINLPSSGRSLCLLLLPLQLLLGVILGLQHDPALGSHGGVNWVVAIFKFVTNWSVINLWNVISPKLWRHLDKITNCHQSSMINGKTFKLRNILTSLSQMGLNNWKCYSYLIQKCQPHSKELQKYLWASQNNCGRTFMYSTIFAAK